MAIQDILKKIEIDGEKKVSVLEKQWNDKIGEEKSKIESELDTYYHQELDRIEKEIDNQERKRFLDAKLENRNKILEKKREIINKLFDEVFSKFYSMDEDKYCNFLADLIKKQGGQDSFEVILNNNDKNKIGKKLISLLGKNYSISDKTASIKAGAILKKEKIEINISFDLIFKDKKEKLEQEVGKIINVI